MSLKHAVLLRLAFHTLFMATEAQGKGPRKAFHACLFQNLLPPPAAPAALFCANFWYINCVQSHV